MKLRRLLAALIVLSTLVGAEVHAVDGTTIRQGNEDRTLDSAGRVIKVVRNGKLIEEREYEEGTTRPKRVRNERGDYSFTYDREGRVLRAERGADAFAEFSYDGHRLDWLREVDRDAGASSEVRFFYNADGRPARVVMKGHPPIDYVYGPDGKAEARSEEGGKGALRLFAIFSRMRSLIQPSGQTLGM